MIEALLPVTCDASTDGRHMTLNRVQQMQSDMSSTHPVSQGMMFSIRDSYDEDKKKNGCVPLHFTTGRANSHAPVSGNGGNRGSSLHAGRTKLPGGQAANSNRRLRKPQSWKPVKDAEGCVRASKLCGKCAELGLESKLRLYQIDMDMAILMCENVDCLHSLSSDAIILPRYFNTVKRLRHSRPMAYRSYPSSLTSSISSGSSSGTSSSQEFSRPVSPVSHSFSDRCLLQKTSSQSVGVSVGTVSVSRGCRRFDAYEPRYGNQAVGAGDMDELSLLLSDIGDVEFNCQSLPDMKGNTLDCLIDGVDSVGITMDKGDQVGGGPVRGQQRCSEVDVADGSLDQWGDSAVAHQVDCVKMTTSSEHLSVKKLDAFACPTVSDVTTCVVPCGLPVAKSFDSSGSSIPQSEPEAETADLVSCEQYIDSSLAHASGDGFPAHHECDVLPEGVSDIDDEGGFKSFVEDDSVDLNMVASGRQVIADCPGQGCNYSDNEQSNLSDDAHCTVEDTFAEDTNNYSGHFAAGQVLHQPCGVGTSVDVPQHVEDVLGVSAEERMVSCPNGMSQFIAIVSGQDSACEPFVAVPSKPQHHEHVNGAGMVPDSAGFCAEHSLSISQSFVSDTGDLVQEEMFAATEFCPPNNLVDSGILPHPCDEPVQEQDGGRFLQGNSEIGEDLSPSMVFSPGQQCGQTECEMELVQTEGPTSALFSSDSDINVSSVGERSTYTTTVLEAFDDVVGQPIENANIQTSLGQSMYAAKASSVHYHHASHQTAFEKFLEARGSVTGRSRQAHLHVKKKTLVMTCDTELSGESTRPAMFSDQFCSGTKLDRGEKFPECELLDTSALSNSSGEIQLPRARQLSDGRLRAALYVDVVASRSPADVSVADNHDAGVTVGCEGGLGAPETDAGSELDGEFVPVARVETLSHLPAEADMFSLHNDRLSVGSADAGGLALVTSNGQLCPLPASLASRLQRVMSVGQALPASEVGNLLQSCGFDDADTQQSLHQLLVDSSGALHTGIVSTHGDSPLPSHIIQPEQLFSGCDSSSSFPGEAAPECQPAQSFGQLHDLAEAASEEFLRQPDLNDPGMTSGSPCNFSSGASQANADGVTDMLPCSSNQAPVPRVMLDIADFTGGSDTVNLFIQWQNVDALCWLDVLLCPLVHSPSLSRYMTSERMEAMDGGVLHTLFTAFRQAQSMLENMLVRQEEDDARLRAGDPSVDIPSMGIVNKDNIAEIGQAVGLLYSARENIWKSMQPRLRCEKGKHDSPVFAMPLMVREIPDLKRLFSVRYRLEFGCQACGYQQRDEHHKILPSLPSVPDDFSMAQPSFVRPCFQCQAPEQRMSMIFVETEDFLLLHFVNGLPHNRFHELDFNHNGDSYMVTSVVEYRRSPDHFICWIRSAPGHDWMECDDLKSVLTRFLPGQPCILPSQVHIVMWERDLRLEHTRNLINTPHTDLLASLVLTVQYPAATAAAPISTPTQTNPPSTVMAPMPDSVPPSDYPNVMQTISYPAAPIRRARGRGSRGRRSRSRICSSNTDYHILRHPMPLAHPGPRQMISTLGSSSIHRGVAPLSAKRKVFILRSGSGGLQAISPHSLSPAVLDALQKQGVNVAQLKKAVLVPQSSHSQSSSVTKVLTLPGHVPRTADSGTADSLQSTEASEAAAALMSCMEEETAPVAELSTAHFQSVQTLASPLCENAVVQYQTVTGARFPTPTTMPHDAGFPLSGAVLHSADYQAQQLHDVAGMTLSNLYQDSQALRAVSTGSKTIQVIPMSSTNQSQRIVMMTQPHRGRGGSISRAHHLIPGRKYKLTTKADGTRILTEIIAPISPHTMIGSIHPPSSSLRVAVEGEQGETRFINISSPSARQDQSVSFVSTMAASAHKDNFGPHVYPAMPAIDNVGTAVSAQLGVDGSIDTVSRGLQSGASLSSSGTAVHVLSAGMVKPVSNADVGCFGSDVTPSVPSGDAEEEARPFPPLLDIRQHLTYRSAPHKSVEQARDAPVEGVFGGETELLGSQIDWENADRNDYSWQYNCRRPRGRGRGRGRGSRGRPRARGRGTRGRPRGSRLYPLSFASDSFPFTSTNASSVCLHGDAGLSTLTGQNFDPIVPSQPSTVPHAEFMHPGAIRELNRAMEQPIHATSCLHALPVDTTAEIQDVTALVDSAVCAQSGLACLTGGTDLIPPAEAGVSQALPVDTTAEIQDVTALVDSAVCAQSGLAYLTGGTDLIPPAEAGVSQALPVDTTAEIQDGTALVDSAVCAQSGLACLNGGTDLIPPAEAGVSHAFGMEVGRLDAESRRDALCTVQGAVDDCPYMMHYEEGVDVAEQEIVTMADMPAVEQEVTAGQETEVALPDCLPGVSEAVEELLDPAEDRLTDVLDGHSVPDLACTQERLSSDGRLPEPVCLRTVDASVAGLSCLCAVGLPATALFCTPTTDCSASGHSGVSTCVEPGLSAFSLVVDPVAERSVSVDCRVVGPHVSSMDDGVVSMLSGTSVVGEPDSQLPGLPVPDSAAGRVSTCLGSTVDAAIVSSSDRLTVEGYSVDRRAVESTGVCDSRMDHAESEACVTDETFSEQEILSLSPVSASPEPGVDQLNFLSPDSPVNPSCRHTNRELLTDATGTAMVSAETSLAETLLPPAVPLSTVFKCCLESPPGVQRSSTTYFGTPITGVFGIDSCEISNSFIYKVSASGSPTTSVVPVELFSSADPIMSHELLPPMSASVSHGHDLNISPAISSPASHHHSGAMGIGQISYRYRRRERSSRSGFDDEDVDGSVIAQFQEHQQNRDDTSSIDTGAQTGLSSAEGGGVLSGVDTPSVEHNRSIGDGSCNPVSTVEMSADCDILTTVDGEKGGATFFDVLQFETSRNSLRDVRITSEAGSGGINNEELGIVREAGGAVRGTVVDGVCAPTVDSHTCGSAEPHTEPSPHIVRMSEYTAHIVPSSEPGTICTLQSAQLDLHKVRCVVPRRIDTVPRCDQVDDILAHERGVRAELVQFQLEGCVADKPVESVGREADLHAVCQDNDATFAALGTVHLSHTLDSVHSSECLLDDSGARAKDVVGSSMPDIGAFRHNEHVTKMVGEGEEMHQNFYHDPVNSVSSVSENMHDIDPEVSCAISETCPTVRLHIKPRHLNSLSNIRNDGYDNNSCKPHVIIAASKDTVTSNMADFVLESTEGTIDVSNQHPSGGCLADPRAMVDEADVTALPTASFKVDDFQLEVSRTIQEMDEDDGGLSAGHRADSERRMIDGMSTVCEISHSTDDVSAFLDDCIGCRIPLGADSTEYTQHGPNGVCSLGSGLLPTACEDSSTNYSISLSDDTVSEIMIKNCKVDVFESDGDGEQAQEASVVSDPGDGANVSILRCKKMSSPTSKMLNSDDEISEAFVRDNAVTTELLNASVENAVTDVVPICSLPSHDATDLLTEGHRIFPPSDAAGYIPNDRAIVSLQRRTALSDSRFPPFPEHYPPIKTQLLDCPQGSSSVSLRRRRLADWSSQHHSSNVSSKKDSSILDETCAYLRAITSQSPPCQDQSPATADCGCASPGKASHIENLDGMTGDIGLGNMPGEIDSDTVNSGISSDCATSLFSCNRATCKTLSGGLTGAILSRAVVGGISAVVSSSTESSFVENVGHPSCHLASITTSHATTSTLPTEHCNAISDSVLETGEVKELCEMGENGVLNGDGKGRSLDVVSDRKVADGVSEAKLPWRGSEGSGSMLSEDAVSVNVCQAGEPIADVCPTTGAVPSPSILQSTIPNVNDDVAVECPTKSIFSIPLQADCLSSGNGNTTDGQQDFSFRTLPVHAVSGCNFKDNQIRMASSSVDSTGLSASGVKSASVGSYKPVMPSTASPGSSMTPVRRSSRQAVPSRRLRESEMLKRTKSDHDGASGGKKIRKNTP